jgi:hypothetical protein
MSGDDDEVFGVCRERRERNAHLNRAQNFLLASPVREFRMPAFP